MKNEPIPADSESQCQCCGRTHRKLFLIEGFRVGQSCGKNISLFKKYPNKDSFIWNGCHAQFDKVSKMMAAK